MDQKWYKELVSATAADRPYYKLHDTVFMTKQSQGKTLVIPDIHNDFKLAEGIIYRERPDHTVFLGDYFDDWYDTVQDAANVAKWLRESIENPDRTHLAGNHDIGYMTDNPGLKWGGYTLGKHVAVKRCKIDWKRLRTHCWIGDEAWLCTHAGVSAAFLKECGYGTIHEALRASERDLKNIDDTSMPGPFFQAGASRGGDHAVGGPLWCDYGEFEDVAGTRQIFGHTRAQAVRYGQNDTAEHYCIDTGLWHYAVYEDGKMGIFRV